ncbi:MAG TPA: thermonuclease family protein [Mesorhizobium sp.]|nr:thermonuclease family protein [Mesorhizobium sp.]
MTVLRRVRRSRKSGPLGRLGDVLLALAILAAAAFAAHRIDPPQTFSRSGPVKVHDGDTLTVAGERVRLIGIDAPELKQTCRRQNGDYPCGRVSRDALVALIGGRDVSCRADKRDRYRRLLGRCHAGGTDLNAELIRSGWAVAYGAEYRDLEAGARAKGEGLWAGSFETPRDWRTRHGDAADLEFGVVAEWIVSLGEAVGLIDPIEWQAESETEGL